MLKTTALLILLLAAVGFGLTLTGGPNQPASTASPAAVTPVQAPKATGDVLVTVNDVPIGEADVRLALSRGGHGKELAPDHRKNVLEVIIGRELKRQRAVEIGLDVDLTYQENLRRMEAQLNAFKRRALSELLQRDMTRRVEISEEEAKRYFAKNAARVRTELRVWQILKREEGLIQQALSDIEHGASFEDVARRQFPNLPKRAGEPWDLGYLRWKQVPEAWRDVIYDLKKGEVSGVIRGPNSRFWIIKLLDKRENAAITYDSIKPMITEVLKNAKIEKLRDETDRELRAKASIVYLKRSVEAPEE